MKAQQRSPKYLEYVFQSRDCIRFVCSGFKVHVGASVGHEGGRSPSDITIMRRGPYKPRTGMVLSFGAFTYSRAHQKMQ